MPIQFIQIASIQENDHNDSYLFALDNTGQVWRLQCPHTDGQYKWERVEGKWAK